MAREVPRDRIYITSEGVTSEPSHLLNIAEMHPLFVSKAPVFCLLVLLAALLPGDAASTASKQNQVAQRIPLSRVFLPERASIHRRDQVPRLSVLIQEKSASGSVGIFYNASSYALVGTVSVGSPGEW